MDGGQQSVDLDHLPPALCPCLSLQGFYRAFTSSQRANTNSSSSNSSSASGQQPSPYIAVRVEGVTSFPLSFSYSTYLLNTSRPLRECDVLARYKRWAGNITCSLSPDQDVRDDLTSEWAAPAVGCAGLYALLLWAVGCLGCRVAAQAAWACAHHPSLPGQQWQQQRHFCIGF